MMLAADVAARALFQATDHDVIQTLGGNLVRVQCSPSQSYLTTGLILARGFGGDCSHLVSSEVGIHSSENVLVVCC